jgi:transposase InsO family protein
MPWKEINVMDQRTEFIVRVFKQNAPFNSVCQDFGISPKTGYKWLNRFIEEGIDGLEDRSRRPHRHSSQLTEDVICRLIKLKTAHMNWGPKKIADLYAKQYGNGPSRSSVHRVLKKAGLVTRKRRQLVNPSQRLVHRFEAKFPNDIWTVDFKGWWYTQDRQRCEPLTVRDDFSRYVLTAVPLKNSRTETVRAEFERLFKVYGLPIVIRSDNGTPFASTQAIFGLSRLSAWFIALGIQLDRIKPGCPYQNGGHERMHRDIRFEVQNVVKGDLEHNAASLEIWRKNFNEKRPHEALNMKTPSEVYKKSSRKYRGTPDKIDYPLNFVERKVNPIGQIVINSQAFYISASLKGWTVGLKPLNESELDVHFAYLNLGSINLETSAFVPNTIATQ